MEESRVGRTACRISPGSLSQSTLSFLTFLQSQRQTTQQFSLCLSASPSLPSCKRHCGFRRLPLSETLFSVGRAPVHHFLRSISLTVSPSSFSLAVLRQRQEASPQAAVCRLKEGPEARRDTEREGAERETLHAERADLLPRTDGRYPAGSKSPFDKRLQSCDRQSLESEKAKKSVE
uniref:Uncharacterized protein n=1 Tax=Toxoplasma gondii (strain ATCC 50861 / VEG) TaxID=432359 RepID=A0A0F7UR85_TOXGV|nr:TPA: hypothetical protein BN1205_013290 [Toxoplasma gondii VEG]